MNAPVKKNPVLGTKFKISFLIRIGSPIRNSLKISQVCY
jgi:hypothetical protein